MVPQKGRIEPLIIELSITGVFQDPVLAEAFPGTSGARDVSVWIFKSGAGAALVAIVPKYPDSHMEFAISAIRTRTRTRHDAESAFRTISHENSSFREKPGLSNWKRKRIDEKSCESKGKSVRKG